MGQDTGRGPDANALAYGNLDPTAPLGKLTAILDPDTNTCACGLGHPHAGTDAILRNTDTHADPRALAVHTDAHQNAISNRYRRFQAHKDSYSGRKQRQTGVRDTGGRTSGAG